MFAKSISKLRTKIKNINPLIIINIIGFNVHALSSVSCFSKIINKGEVREMLFNCLSKSIRGICFVVFAFVFIVPGLHSQTNYSSYNGNTIPVTGKVRILNVFVNIIYDQTPERDPFYNVHTPHWLPGKPDVLNDSPPVYLRGFLDSDTLVENFPVGVMTRIFHEASFGRLKVLGDFMVVNIMQSEITPDKPADNFNLPRLLTAVFNKINTLGGVNTINAYNSLDDYDFFEKGNCGVAKVIRPNKKVDFLQVMIRNTANKTDKNGKAYNYGQYNPGQGATWAASVCNNCMLSFKGAEAVNELTSVQCIGDKNLSQDLKSIIFHEFAHNLFGDNSFHTSGGNHYGTYSTNVFLGLEAGYGLMGGYNSGLVSCNAYERLRAGWTSPVFNPEALNPSASNVFSDISLESGNKSFLLRDFITTGDAIRIKLPLGDSTFAPQFLWLENHRIGSNNALDFFQYSNTSECRPAGKAGIYAYVQVGRDILESKVYDDVFNPNFTDNLRLVTAGGNWDYEQYSDSDSVNCVTYSQSVRGAKQWKPNAFKGYNTKQTHFYLPLNNVDVIKDVKLGSYLWVSRLNRFSRTELPFLGDETDAFTGNVHMNMGTNPAPVNVITWFVRQGGGTINADKRFQPMKKTVLSGLGISMHENADGSFNVDVVWDDYLVRQDARWTGEIVLAEKIILDNNKQITLDLSGTHEQLSKDTTTGVFAKPTRLEVVNGGELVLSPKSKLILKNGSCLFIGNGSKLVLKRKASVIVRKGSSIIWEDGSILYNNGGKIRKKSFLIF